MFSKVIIELFFGFYYCSRFGMYTNVIILFLNLLMYILLQFSAIEFGFNKYYYFALSISLTRLGRLSRN